MTLRIKTSLLVLFLLIYLSSGVVKSFDGGASTMHSLHEDGLQMKPRKLLALDAYLDYDYPGPNSKHDPRRGRPGGGSGKNP